MPSFLPEDKDRLINFYSANLEHHGPNSTASLYWSDLYEQQKRFEVLCQERDLNGKKILDYGCGLGDFYGFLKKKYKNFSYIGIDVVPNFIMEARLKYPMAKFEVSDIGEVKRDSFDYVLASGVFSFKIDNYEKVYFSKIKKMYEVAREGVAFNMLNKECHPDNELFATYYIKDVEEYCKGFIEEVVVNNGYMKEDFTVFLGFG